MSEKTKRNKEEIVLQETEEEIEFRIVSQIKIDKKCHLKCSKCSKILGFDEKKKNLNVHPILKVLFCRDCEVFYGDGEFSLDEDGDEKYCRWCGEGGTLFLCSKCICGFCPNCITRNFSLKYQKKIKKDDNWVCFVCNPKPLWKARGIAAEALKKGTESVNDELSNESSNPVTPENICNPAETKSTTKEVAEMSDGDDENSQPGQSKDQNSNFNKKRKIDDTKIRESESEKETGRDISEKSGDNSDEGSTSKTLSDLKGLYRATAASARIISFISNKRLRKISVESIDSCKLKIGKLCAKIKPILCELEGKFNDVLSELG